MGLSWKLTHKRKTVASGKDTPPLTMSLAFQSTAVLADLTSPTFL